MKTKDILNTDRGARFYRGDRHIHSTAGSHDVTDRTATPEAIVRLAHDEGLDLIAIADHNEISGINGGRPSALLLSHHRDPHPVSLSLRATPTTGWIVSRGSIDHPETRNHACAILEGSEEAFRGRARIYGIR